MNHTYAIYGLTLQIPFPCPGLPAAVAGAKPDVIVEEGIVTRQLDAPIAKEQSWDIEPGRFLWRGGRFAGRFLVEGGTRITLERNPAAEDVRLAVHFMASVLAVLLQQRGLMVLHANALITPNGAVVISGESGAGKSTTLAALLARGCPMLSDDITVLQQGEDGILDVLPGAPHLHLCEDTAEEFKYNIKNLPRYPWRRMKASVPIHGAMADEAAPLRTIYLLKKGSGDKLLVQYLSGKDKFAVLRECYYGPIMPEDQPGQLSLQSAVINQVAVCRIERPESRRSVNEIAEVIYRG